MRTFRSLGLILDSPSVYNTDREETQGISFGRQSFFERGVEPRPADFVQRSHQYRDGNAVTTAMYRWFIPNATC